MRRCSCWVLVPWLLSCSPSPIVTRAAPAPVARARPTGVVAQPPPEPVAAVAPTLGTVVPDVPASCAPSTEAVRDVVARRKGAGRLRIFDAPSGFDLFWIEVEQVPHPNAQPTRPKPTPKFGRKRRRRQSLSLFHQMWAPLDEEGKRLGKPRRLRSPFFTRFGTHHGGIAGIVKERTPLGIHTGQSALWLCTRPTMTCSRTASLPDGPEGHGGGYGLAFDEAHREWGIL